MYDIRIFTCQEVQILNNKNFRTNGTTTNRAQGDGFSLPFISTTKKDERFDSNFQLF